MSVIIPQQSGRSTTIERAATGSSSSAQLAGWRILGWLGVAFFIMSLLDLALGWYPVNFGAPEWEYGTISGTVSALSIPTLALYLTLAAVIVDQRVGMTKAIGIVMILLALLLPAMGILYLTTIPLALKSTATNDVMHFAMKKAILRTLILGSGYEILFVFGALKALRRRAPL